MRHAPPQEVARRHEVGIEDRQHFAACTLQAGGERSGLESPAGIPVQELHIEAASAQHRGAAPGEPRGAIGRVIENLNLQAIARVVEIRHGFEQPAGDETFVVERQLHAHRRPFDRFRGRPPVLQCAHREHEQNDAIGAVEDEQRANDIVERRQCVTRPLHHVLPSPTPCRASRASPDAPSRTVVAAAGNFQTARLHERSRGDGRGLVPAGSMAQAGACLPHAERPRMNAE